MTGADADTEQEVATDQADGPDSVRLARFLTPVPRPRSSVPAPDHDSREVMAESALAPQRTSLFDDLLVPRRNSSLLPPPGDATAGTRDREIDDESTDEVVGKAPDEDGFEEHESPTSNLTLEKSLDDELDTDEDDFIRLPRSPASILSTRGAGTALAAIVILIAVVFAWSRAGRPVRDAAVTGVAVGAPAAAPAFTPADEIADPLDDPGYEVPTPDVEKGRDLRREARRYLEAGRAEEGVGVARRAIEADANDPEGYILLAAGLQDLGRWQESRDVFVKCVRESNGKANAECVYFATRSK